MKKLPVLKSLAFFGAMILLVFACSFTSPKDHSAKDNYKNIIADDYPSVIIGSQEWMTKNLNVDVFRNGDPIPEAKTVEEWTEAGINQSPAWCYYDNDPANGNKYGKLYNWFAVNETRGLAPEGWHVPSDEEWRVLTTNLGEIETEGKINGTPFWYTTIAGGKMKSTGTQFWKSPNEDATNSSGFSGLPGGIRDVNGDFYNIGSYGSWWSSSENVANKAWVRFLGYSSGDVNRYYNYRSNGLSVRCLRD